MGSSKYQISVASTAMHLISVPKDPLAAIAKTAVLAGTDMLSTIFMASSSGNLNTKMTALMDYAETDYTLALPSGIIPQVTEPSKSDIASAIADAISYPYNIVVMTDAYKAYAPHHDILEYMIESRGLNVIANTINKWDGLSFSNGQQMIITDSFVSSDNLNIIVMYDYYEYVTTTAYDYDGYLYSVVTFTKTGNYTEEVLRPNIVHPGYGDECLIASYLKTDFNSVQIDGVFYWIYRLQDNTYPQLDLRTRTIAAGKYFPVVPIRANNIDLTGQQGTNTEAIKASPLYQTSKTLLNFIGTQIDYLGEQVNSNPNVASIDNAYVMFGADMQSNEKATLEYLNNYFDYLGSLDINSYSTYDPALNVNPANATFTEHGLVLHMSFGPIKTSFIPGVIDDGKVGNARKTMTHADFPAVYATEGDNTYLVSGGGITSTLTLDLQVSTTTIRRVTVVDLVVTNYISGNNLVVTTLYDVDTDSENHSCIIPLEYNIAMTIPVVNRANLYADCCLLIVTCIERVKLKWYERSWFSMVIMIVMMVIIVVALIYGQPWIAKIVAEVGLAFMSVEAFLLFVWVTIVPAIIEAIAIGYLAKILIQAVGIELGIVLAVVLAAVAITTGNFEEGMKLLTQYTMMTPQLALTLSMAVINAADIAVQVSMMAITSNYQAFTNLLAKAYESLETNSEIQALSFSNDLDPYAVLNRNNKFLTLGGETAQMFFNRTLNLVDTTYNSVHTVIPNFTANLLAIHANKPIGM
jgi:hypothetical protein